MNEAEKEQDSREADKRLKIGVMTFWESQENYGQLLQAYAFQTHLRKKGLDPFIIKYNKSQSVKKHKPGFFQKLRTVNWKKALELKAVQMKLSTAMSHLPALPDRGFEEFKTRFLNFTPNLYTSIKELVSAPPKADIYIAGSDQVWNYKFIGDFEPYFLQFGNQSTRRISYAASFGHRELPASVKNKYRQYLETFETISVREDSGLSLCRDMGFEDTCLLPDPTLLVKRDDWIGLCNENEQFNSSKGKKVFIYTLGNRSSEAKDQLVSYLGGRGDTTVAHASVHNDTSGNIFPSIEEWLGYIKACDVVVTNSFHAMLFSTIMNKNFIGLPSAGDKAGMNERLQTLVKEFGLEKHLLYRFDKKLVNDIMNLEVNWDEVNKKIDSWRTRADSFLMSMSQ